MTLNSLSLPPGSTNRCTLIVDGNWLLMSRAIQMTPYLTEGRPDIDTHVGHLLSTMHRSLVSTCHTLTPVDNVLIVADARSWRKDVPDPITGQCTYKDNRRRQQDALALDWTKIYSAFDTFCTQCGSALHIPVVRCAGAEGDDQIYFWTRALTARGTSCVIWSSDRDLQQLVHTDTEHYSFTVWYEQKAGLVCSDTLAPPTDLLSTMLGPVGLRESQLFTELLARVGKKVTYINPVNIVLAKMLAGDKSDHVEPVFTWETTNRHCGIGPKDAEKLIDLCGSPSSPAGMDPHVLYSALNSVKKFASRHPAYEDIAARLDYNRKMVWLDESQIPESIRTGICNGEYGYTDMAALRAGACINDTPVPDQFACDDWNLFDNAVKK